MIDPATKQEWLTSLRAKQQRATMAPYWVITALILGVGLALFAGRVWADAFRAPRGDVVLVRHQAQCEDADILAALLKMGAGHLVGDFKKATLTWEGRDWRSCWIEADGYVYSIDETGELLQPIPASLFKDGPGA